MSASKNSNNYALKNSSFGSNTTPLNKHILNREANNESFVLETPLENANRSANFNVSALKQETSSILGPNKEPLQRSVLEKSHRNGDFWNERFVRQNTEQSPAYNTEQSLVYNNEKSLLYNNEQSVLYNQLSGKRNHLFFTKTDALGTKKTQKRQIKNSMVEICEQNVVSPTSSSNYYASNNTFQRKFSVSGFPKTEKQLRTADPSSFFWNINQSETMDRSIYFDDLTKKEKQVSSSLFIANNVRSILCFDEKKKRSYKMEQKFHKTLHRKHRSSGERRIDVNYTCCDRDFPKKEVRHIRQSRRLAKGLKLIDASRGVLGQKDDPFLEQFPKETVPSQYDLDRESRDLLHSIARKVDRRIQSSGAGTVDMYIMETLSSVYNIR